MSQRGVRTKREVSKEELEKFLADNGPFEFDGLRYTKSEGMQGGSWNKPIAVTQATWDTQSGHVVPGSDKFYLIED